MTATPPPVDDPLHLATSEACLDVAHYLGWARAQHGPPGLARAIAALREVLDKESQG